MIHNLRHTTTILVCILDRLVVNGTWTVGLLDSLTVRLLLVLKLFDSDELADIH